MHTLHYRIGPFEWEHVQYVLQMNVFLKSIYMFTKFLKSIKYTFDKAQSSVTARLQLVSSTNAI